MKAAILLILATSLALGQTSADSTYITYDATATTMVASAVTIGYNRGPSIALQVTAGGGLVISDDKDNAVIAEILPDGTIKGDKVRALRMLAGAMAAAFPQMAKREPLKEPEK